MHFSGFAPNVTTRVPFAFPVVRRRRNPLKHLLLVIHLRFRTNVMFTFCSKRYYTCSVCVSGGASSSGPSLTLTNSSTFAISQKVEFQDFVKTLLYVFRLRFR